MTYQRVLRCWWLLWFAFLCPHLHGHGVLLLGLSRVRSSLWRLAQRGRVLLYVSTCSAHFSLHRPFSRCSASSSLESSCSSLDVSWSCPPSCFSCSRRQKMSLLKTWQRECGSTIGCGRGLLKMILLKKRKWSLAIDQVELRFFRDLICFSVIS